MQYREVGNTGLKISEIGFGGGGNAGLMLRGTHEQQREAIARAVDLGINYFDQAPDYGDGLSETNLGRVLKELRIRPYITTKVEIREENLNNIADHVVRSTEASLQRMGVDYADFIQIHNGPRLDKPNITGAAYNYLWIEDFLRPGGALEGLQRLQKAGKARSVGFITRGGDGQASRQLIDTGAFDLINASVHLLNPSAGAKPFGMNMDPDWDGILAYAAAHGVGAAIYSPLAGGFLNDNAVSGGSPHPLGRGARNEEEGARINSQIGAFAFLSKKLNPEQADDHSLAEAAIRYVLSLEGVTSVLGGFSDVPQVEENTAFSGKGPLSEQNMKRIEMVWRGNFGV